MPLHHDTTRTNSLRDPRKTAGINFRLTQEEHDLIAAAAAPQKPAFWVRQVAVRMAKAKLEKARAKPDT